MATQYTDNELEQLLENLESDLAERKESWKGDAPERGRQAICAFANDLPNHQKAGVLFVGVKDDGTPTKIEITDQLITTLASIKTDGKILPPPSITVEKRTLKGCDVAVVVVEPADAPPVRYDGRTWIRIGSRRGTSTVQDERILNEKRRHRDLPFDIQPFPSATLQDISRVLFEEEYLPNAFAPDVLEANERSYEQRLAACRMIASADNPIPTTLGLLVLGKSPQDWMPGAYIQFLRIDGTELSDPVIDEATIDGHLTQILRRIDEKMDAHNRTSVNITSDIKEIRQSSYPRAALQQIIRNAVMHRTYEGTHTPVRVYWFNDRIEIINSGGPYGVVTRENFGKPGFTDYRNPYISEAMKVLGFVQRFGVGIQTARKELKQNGNPEIEFKVESTAILCTIRKKA
jgi:ATP-dependent DNA helicase RecG